MKPRTLLIFFVIITALIGIFEYNLTKTRNGSLLFVLSFWVTLVEGSIALVAIAEITSARWLSSVKRELLSLSPLLLFFSFLFIFLEPHLSIYPWAGKEGMWFNKWFFMLRNFVLLMLAYLSSRKFSVESSKEGKNKNFYAVIYLLIFAASQSLVAFDWVMSLSYPWVSTLFGGYFLIESIYSGLAMSGIFYFTHYNESREKISVKLESSLKDISTMIFGFSLLWAGLFYAQYLVIWYGNIPEETSFVLERISTSPFRELSYLILITLFFAPFVILLSKKAKKNPRIVLAVSIFILSGIFIERFIFLVPSMSLKTYALIFEFFSITLLFAMFVINKNLFLPPQPKDI